MQASASPIEPPGQWSGLAGSGRLTLLRFSMVAADTKVEEARRKVNADERMLDKRGELEWSNLVCGN